MRIKARRIVLSIIILSILLLGMYPLLGHPRVFSIKDDCDINSGDVRRQIYVCFFRIKNEIHETAFSREVRRLGILVGEERIWKSTYKKVLTIKCIYIPFGGTIAKCNFLIEMFDVAKVSDQDRLEILERVFISLQEGKLTEREVDKELQAILDRAEKNQTKNRENKEKIWTVEQLIKVRLLKKVSNEVAMASQ